MQISTSVLRNRALRYGTTPRFKNLSEARIYGRQTAFLSHSHQDRELAKGLQVLLSEAGWKVYLDWEDTTMPASPNRETAAKLQQRIRQCNWFLFLSTARSMGSRWCPWEIGHADGIKPTDSILIVPTEQNGQYYGNEYLELYRRIELTDTNSLRAFDPNQQYFGVPLSDLRAA